MYEYNKNHLEINGIEIDFEYDIRTIIQYTGKYVVLLGIPFDRNFINNIYCFDDYANLLWRSENLDSLYPNSRNLPYENMGIKDDIVFASDFYGRNYRINLNDGKIIEYDIVK